MSRITSDDPLEFIRAGGAGRGEDAGGDGQVRPGDVISSELFNSMLRRLAKLEARVGSLEDRAPAEEEEHEIEIITGVEPKEGQAVGQVVNVTGIFVTPATANTVFVDQTAITDFVSAGSGQLSFKVPATFIVQAGTTKNVKLSVENIIGKSVREYVLKPPAQAEADDPEISAVDFINIRTGGSIGVGGLTKATGMVVRGRNFAETAADNQVRLEFSTGRKVVRLPSQGSLTVDKDKSNVKQLTVALPAQRELSAVAQALVVAVVVRARGKEARHVIREEDERLVREIESNAREFRAEEDAPTRSPRGAARTGTLASRITRDDF